MRLKKYIIASLIAYAAVVLLGYIQRGYLTSGMEGLVPLVAVLLYHRKSLQSKKSL